RLEGHRDLAPANPAELLVRERQQVELLAGTGGEADAAARDSGRAREHAQQREAEGRLARAALADQRDRLALADAQARAAHGLHPTGGRLVLDPEVLDLQDRRGRGRCRAPDGIELRSARHATPPAVA